MNVITQRQQSPTLTQKIALGFLLLAILQSIGGYISIHFDYSPLLAWLSLCWVLPILVWAVLGRLVKAPGLNVDTFTGPAADVSEQESSSPDEPEAMALINLEASGVGALSGISHEVLTPMNGVIGMTELLLETDLSDRQRHIAESARVSARALLKIISNLLDLVKLKTGSLRVEERAFELRDLVVDLHREFSPGMAEKSLTFEMTIARDMPHRVVADYERLRDILHNLLSNALKYTDGGGVTFDVTWKASTVVDSRIDGELLFEVRDTGCGIEADAGDDIFTAFSPHQTKQNENSSYSGLGLAISAQLADLMGGTIEYDSTLGEGSCFQLTVPVENCESLATMSEQLKNNDNAMKGKRVLIVDENAVNRDLLLSHAQSWGADAKACATVEAGLAAAREAADKRCWFDIVLADFNMPGLDGMQFSLALSNMDGLESPEVFVLSSVAQDFSADQLRTHGVSRFLQIPMIRDDLYRVISHSLALRVAPLPSERFHTESEVADRQARLAKAKLLVAEDNPVNQELIGMLLEGFGCTFEIVENGQLALDALDRTPFDLIVMDCQMPVMDGLEATQCVRQRGLLARNQENIPILALTANAMPGDRQRCFDAGMNSYMSKPFSSEALADTLLKLLPELSVLSSLHEAGSKEGAVANTERQEKSSREDGILDSVQDETLVLDSASLERLRAMQREGQPDIVARLAAVYLDTSPKLIDSVEEGLRSCDAKQVEIGVHTLKSSSANLGALAFSEMCAEAEQQARQGDLDKVATSLDQLKQAFNRVCDALQLEMGDA